MPVILAKWVLELELPAASEGLRPFGLVLTAEYPALIVLGLDYEYAKARHDNVVNLNGAITGLQSYVVERVVDTGVEKQLCSEAAHRFSDQPLEH